MIILITNKTSMLILYFIKQAAMPDIISVSSE